MIKLLPCPFCGGEAKIMRYGDRSQSTIYECQECGCRLETGEEWGHGNDWNNRHNYVIAHGEVREVKVSEFPKIGEKNEN